ncbi:30S ribosomal protein S20 [Candidatus Cytomitobacter primus]|uniref:Small ribosomal subunit protein bS20 n=1 Tax=Candidatus Cytomitobacter primus TaxID=2066024 RepID=A0A5C0UH14_9PROT|nr:30S ribosomal protein S20 [Candidatus Cytomitobacter primus]QEK38324.1 30S ribosomal protein S20 [Candidatus Cytomitobacter primus]
MANHTATKKRIRRDLKVRKSNKHDMSKLRTVVKSLKKSIENKENNADLFRKTQAYISKCGQKRIIHPANADRKISKLSKMFHSTV